MKASPLKLSVRAFEYMANHDIATTTNHLRRGIGLLIAVTPIGLATACIFGPRLQLPYFPKLGLALVLSALALGCFNFYLAFIRPRLHERKGGTLENYKFVSVIPAVGTLLQMAGLVIGFSHSAIGSLGLLAALIDAGGIPWFVASTWKDGSFWDS